MNLKEKLQTAWKNKEQIAEGFFNAWVSSGAEVKEEALRRLAICRANACGMYNPKGENNETVKAVFSGAESCGGCGCKLYEMCHAMSKTCSLYLVGKEPLWEALITEDQEKEAHDIAFRKQQEWEQAVTGNQTNIENK